MPRTQGTSTLSGREKNIFLMVSVLKVDLAGAHGRGWSPLSVRVGGGGGGEGRQRRYMQGQGMGGNGEVGGKREAAIPAAYPASVGLSCPGKQGKHPTPKRKKRTSRGAVADQIHAPNAKYTPTPIKTLRRCSNSVGCATSGREDAHQPPAGDHTLRGARYCRPPPSNTRDARKTDIPRAAHSSFGDHRTFWVKGAVSPKRDTRTSL